MAFAKVGSVLPKIKDRVKQGSVMEAAYVVQIANLIFKNMAEEALWDQVRVVYFKQGVLTVACSSSVVAQTVRYMELGLKSELRRQTGVELKRVSYVNKNL